MVFFVLLFLIKWLLDGICVEKLIFCFVFSNRLNQRRQVVRLLEGIENQLCSAVFLHTILYNIIIIIIIIHNRITHKYAHIYTQLGFG